MSKSIKLPDTYLSTKSVVQNKKTLYERLKNQDTFILPEVHINSAELPRYFLLAKLPKSSDGTSSILHVYGFLGSWLSNGKAIIDLFVANRNTLNVCGTFIGFESAFGNTDLQIFEQENGEHWVYLVQKAAYVGGIVLNISGMNILSLDCNVTPQKSAGIKVKSIDNEVLTKLNK